MIPTELEREVRAKHAAGLSPKEIARALGVRPAAVVPIVRRAAGQRSAEARDQGPPPRCWVSPGWSTGLTVDGGRGWPEDAAVGGVGLVSIVVAHRHGHGKVSMCGYLVDVYCLGAKDAYGPHVMREDELSGFLAHCYRAYRGEPLAAPIDLVRHLVWGAIDYGKTLGFSPHPDFERVKGSLGTLDEPCAIRFGYEGKPMYMQGPHDDARRIMRTLDRSVGRRGYDFVVGPPSAPELSDRKLAPLVLDFIGT
jgi:hypothetical protein